MGGAGSFLALLLMKVQNSRSGPRDQVSKSSSRRRPLPGPRTADDAAVVERLMRLGAACQALAAEKAATRRRLRAVEAELKALKERLPS